MTSKDYQICEDINRTEMGFEANYLLKVPFIDFIRSKDDKKNLL